MEAESGTVRFGDLPAQLDPAVTASAWSCSLAGSGGAVAARLRGY
ncbi:MAG: hypothetical protein R2695_14855 [Acidimicrobiales bacterium]